MDLKKLIEQALSLIEDLTSKIVLVDKQKSEQDQKELRQGGLQVELETFQAELLEREAILIPSEKIQQAQAKVNELKDAAEVECNRIRGEWTNLDEQKAKFAEESRIAKEKIASDNAYIEKEKQSIIDIRAKLDEKEKNYKQEVIDSIKKKVG